MLDRLRTILTSVPAITGVVLFVLYLLGGFFALPALVKWQVEKQVPGQLGHQIRVGDVRFNPLLFRFEVDDLALADPEGAPLLGFKRLLVDFELRSVIDRAWTFAEARIDAPILHLSVDKDGRHNFASLLERLPKSEPEKEDQGLPRFIVQRVALTDGRLDFSDRQLDDPLVAQVKPLLIEIDHLSSLPEQSASYRLSARTAAGEALETSGELALNPIASKGRLTLSGLQVTTLARGLSRLLAVDAPAGTVDLAAGFDLAVDAGGTLSGVVQDVDFAIASLSLSTVGAASPLLAIQTLSLKQGRVDLAARQASLAGFRLAKGSVAVVFDDDGKLNWEKLVRVTATAPEADAATAPAAATATAVEPAAAAPDENVPKPWRVVVSSAEISALAFGFADPARALAIDVAALGFETSPSVAFAATATRIELTQPQLLLTGTRVKSGADSLSVPDGSIAAGRIAVDITEGRLDLAIDKPRTRFDGMKAQSGADGANLAKFAVAGEKLSLAQADGRLDFTLDQSNTSLAGFEARHGPDAVKLRSAKVASDKLSLTQADATTRIKAGAVQLSLTGLATQQAGARVAWQEASFKAGVIAAAVGAGSSASSALDLRFDDAALKLTALGLVAQGASSEIARIAAATLGAKSLALTLPDGAVDVTGDGLGMTLSDAVFHSPADAATEMLRFGRASVSGGRLRLKDRVLTAEKVTFANGKAQTWLDAEGRFNGLILTRGAVAAAAAAVPDAASAGPDAEAAPSEPAWQVAVKAAEVDSFALGFEDRRGGPRLAVGFEAIRARIAGFATGVTTPMQVEFKAKVARGGDIDVGGSIRADNGASDLQLKLAAIALAPMQPLLSEFAELTLASGTVSSTGRLRYGEPATAGAKLAYKGSFAVDQLQINEIEPERPFVSWDSLATDDALLTVEPNRLDIGELRIVRPAGRLIIAEDQSVNLTDVLKKSKDGEAAPDGSEQVAEDQAAAPAAKAEVAPPEPDAPADDPFPVSVARIRVTDGALEFADLSLRPQFATRMHELKGVITGLGSDPNGSAKMQLDARVDKYGSAKIRGQISVFRPEKLTDIEMTFRNLTMSSLSPYVIKFAGYRIAAGQLALDLQYKVTNSKLRGRNKIVLKKVKLGEKVETPGAADLPLDLAIAILTDSKGVIDIGLPVSGDLGDPQFDYAEVIGNALGNLIGGIVTAPFRALGALFGASDEKLDSIDFEPGSAVLAPPEREKLVTVAHAMQERTTLTLVVPPAHAAEVDTPALKSLAVRTEIVGRMGLELTPGDDPGPIDPANPRAQVAVEALFSERYAPEVLAALKQRALAAMPAKQAGVPAGKPAAVKPPAGPPPAFYQSVLDRLIKEQPISDETLAQLATQRAEAIVAEMTAADGVDAKRVVLGKARPASAATDKAVTLQLELEVAK